MFTYCPTCKNSLTKNNHHYSCPTCGFDYYFNANPSAVVILTNNHNQIYLEKRGRNPRAGLWALPGGFINVHESAEGGAIREIKEELGIDLNNLLFFKSYPNDYIYKGTLYYPLDLFFIASVDLNEISPTETEEFSEGKFFDIDHIPFDELAFESNKKALKDYLESNK
jgi:NADH pyrophosphatase NudC (nudix superfamily)